ncbi:MAG TPA: lysophospholipid acyltransferase family protein [Methylophilaceae bacterium]|nr:lysophospholipid acyltransferase family protein [Methylophilaceae bacterium]
MSKRHSAKLTRLIRAAHLALHIGYGLLTAALVLPWVKAARRDRIISRWCRHLLGVFNIRLVLHGQVPERDASGILFVANHVSWIDIYAINSVRAVRFVAMAEIRRWPVLGWLAAQANTLFTNRSKRHEAGRLVQDVADSLNAGDCLCYFPEGSTSDGSQLKPFKSSLLQAAVDADAIVWPVAILYPDESGQPDPELSYANRTLWGSVKQVLAQQAPIVELHFDKPISAIGQDRRALSSSIRACIAGRLKLMH